MDCPSCGSSHVQTLAMVRQSGTSTVETSGTQDFRGSGLHSEGGFSSTSGSATIKTKAVTTTNIARQAAPPEKATSGWQGIGCLTLLVGVGGGILVAHFRPDWSTSTTDPISAYVFFGSLCVGLLLFVVLMRRAIRYNRKVLPGLRARWSRSWMCLACGRVFEPAFIPRS
jgi:hypothetical protein